MKKLRISRLFHWLYAILMLLPFGYLIFNFVGNCFNQSSNFSIIEFNSYNNLLLNFFDIEFTLPAEGLYRTVFDVYQYLIEGVFSITDDLMPYYIELLLTYWTCISLIWLVFDLIMYVPMLVHSWIDKATIGG